MDNNPISPALIAELVALARRAGDAIMAIYAQEDSYDITHKGDESPLTAADLAAQRVIAAGLPGLLDVPIISEEAALPDFSVRQGWSNYWLVDPLDGTKEFIARNGQFTVNIALVQQGRPLLGVVHVPTSDTTYLGVLAAQQPESLGAWKYTAGHSPQAIRVRDLEARAAAQLPLTLLLSHRHGTQATSELLNLLERRWPGPIETCNAGSSLKFCVIAEGLADFYPRLAPTSEWDTAAAQAVLEAAGGAVVEAVPALNPLRYNSRDDILNPYFYALGDSRFEWADLLAAP
ncbi:3'(2'),5'-bisphosphate nucleotidase [Cellvibrio mixtus]|uniref:3'(2'),5'-bisphosphate nucleotidase CysQ n=1 Tax=Cellvibrio mixtus TaxID=39650 RepID=A0A266QBC7_9GAMM|nr:3'(2'),5'-bisphosphate nucleotidase CysQ [Cellvibrio mixtus]OZY87162.1 3'(2'),5'-bisphosphate nucleotidase [Cellvibrio mixtus]